MELGNTYFIRVPTPNSNIVFMMNFPSVGEVNLQFRTAKAILVRKAKKAKTAAEILSGFVVWIRHAWKPRRRQTKISFLISLSREKGFVSRTFIKTRKAYYVTLLWRIRCLAEMFHILSVCSSSPIFLGVGKAYFNV